MKLSTRTRYGTRALLDLALHRNDQPVQLRKIAARQNLSLHYLEHLIAPLVAVGIIRSTRGAKGGVQLLKHPKDIKLKEIVMLLEGTITPVECVDNPETCSRSKLCVTRDVWDEMKMAMEKVLESTTLQDLVERQAKKDESQEAMYYV